MGGEFAGPAGQDEPPALPVYTTAVEVRRAVAEARGSGQIVGLAPTMGALHAGHARLIEQARREAAFVVVSIFVNPTQFGPGEDFARYPRTPGADHHLCARAGASIVFEPPVSEMYPHGLAGSYVEVPGVSEALEGASRPGHFRGVATVVLKLLNIVGPDLAFFGEKDYQQLLIIRRMVADLALAVSIRPVPIVREPDGLALSSRNRYLNGQERQAATVLWRALGRASEAVQAGERSADRVRQILQQTVELEALARLDYAEVADADTLEPLERLAAGRRAIALLAARVGPARLIDNAVLPT